MITKTFHASWPSVIRSNLLTAFIVRWLIISYILFSLFMFVLLGVTKATSQQWELCFWDLAMLSCVLMGAITLVEFSVCGVRSFCMSSFVMMFFVIVLVSSSPMSLIPFMVFVPYMWLSTRLFLHFICSCFVLPAQITFNGLGGRFPRWRMHTDDAISKARQNLIDSLNGEVLSLVTPDNLPLDAMFFASKDMRSKQQQHMDDHKPLMLTPTLILFNGNNESYEFKDSDIAMYLRAGFSVVGFNYRGVSANRGWVSRDGLILDAVTCYQFVRDHLNVPDSMIGLVGTSLGGAIATETAVLHPGCTLCSDRSFSCLTTETQEVAPAVFCQSKHTTKGWIIGQIVATLVCFAGWEFRAYLQFPRVRGFKYIIFHPEDSIIPERARLVTSLRGDPGLRILQLKPDHFRTLPEDGLSLSDDEAHIGQYAHCRGFYEDERLQHLALLRSGFDANRE